MKTKIFVNYKENSEYIYFYLAESYEANDEIDKAISNYLKAITVNEKFHPAYKKVAILYMARNDYDDAIEYLQDYVKLDITELEKENTKSLINKIEKLKDEK